MIAPRRTAHHLLLVWLIFTGAMLFSIFVAWHEGLLEQLYAVDRSRICWAITLLFAVVSVHAASRILRLSAEQNHAAAVQRTVSGAGRGSVTLAHDGLYLDGRTRLPDCLLTDYLRDLAERSLHPGDPAAESGAANAELIEVYRHRLGSTHEFGWFAADLMLKLGLLGTIVGFVMMLGSVLDVSDFTAETMQGVLRNMSTGMGTALYTTFAGLVCSMLTSAQYYLLDEATSGLVETARHLSQTRVLPNLATQAITHA